VLSKFGYHFIFKIPQQQTNVIWCQSWKFRGDGIQWNVIWQRAASRCECYPTFRELTPPPSSYTLKMRTESFPGTSENFRILTRLPAR